MKYMKKLGWINKSNLNTSNQPLDKMPKEVNNIKILFQLSFFSMVPLLKRKVKVKIVKYSKVNASILSEFE